MHKSGVVWTISKIHSIFSMSWKRPNYPCISKPIFHSCFRCSLFRNTVKPQFSRGSVILTLLSIGLFFAQRANDAHMILKSDILICGSSLVGEGGRKEREKEKWAIFWRSAFSQKSFIFAFAATAAFSSSSTILFFLFQLFLSSKWHPEDLHCSRGWWRLVSVCCREWQRHVCSLRISPTGR